MDWRIFAPCCKRAVKKRSFWKLIRLFGRRWSLCVARPRTGSIPYLRSSAQLLLVGKSETIEAFADRSNPCEAQHTAFEPAHAKAPKYQRYSGTGISMVPDPCRVFLVVKRRRWRDRCAGASYRKAKTKTPSRQLGVSHRLGSYTWVLGVSGGLGDAQVGP